jgi:hypothetical protein
MNQQEIDKTYLNKAQSRAYLINPWSYYGIMGRGTGKSVRILAMRSSRLCYEMKGASFAFYGDSYVNLMTNLIPNVTKGWNELGYYDGIHYVVDKAPPEHWDKPLMQRIYDYKHTISWCTGVRFYLISEDRPDSIRGMSVQHFFGDEVKIWNFKKLLAAFPAVRGELIHFQKVPQYRGFSFTTDMPDIDTGNWLLEKEGLMDCEQITLIGLTALEYDRLQLLLIKANTPWRKKIIELHLNILEKELNRIRKKSVFFDTASSLVNVDTLSIDKIDDMLIELGWDDFKKAVLNIKSDSIENMFYAGLQSKHYYPGKFNYDYYDGFGLKDKIERNSIGDMDCNADDKLLGGLDFGNMNSLTISQENGREYRVINFIYTLAPEILQDLAKKFANYYKHHKRKVLDLYYDRSGNNRRNERTTLAEQFKKELLDLKEGWTVNLMSRGWANVPHDQKYVLWMIILSEKDNRFPLFRLNEANCGPLKASMQMSPTKKSLTGGIEKDKKSEHNKNLNKLVFESTNPSDSIDYIVWGKYSHLLKYSNKYLSLKPSIKK